MSAAVSADGSKLTSSLNAVLDPATGALMHATGKVAGLPTQYGVLKATIEVTREKAPASAGGGVSPAGK